ncbi:ABC transporter ATP-binding protein [Acetobacter sp. DsW_063]|uniref:ATP-binding cassette domain-containing protein n=1 Tax=Acetobacter sp. DsW_063 TaxID=1514894 RepID=UPI000A35D96F|nr:ABC transporter ATP-binding protein [Acetobacter sp. DsW_063]
MNAPSPVLAVQELAVTYHLPGEPPVNAVSGVSFSVRPGEILAIVGESGSGKSSIVSALIGLKAPNARIGGRILLEGEDIAAATPQRLRALRGRRIGFVPQDAGLSLSPLRRIDAQIDEALRVHGMPRHAARARTAEILADIGLGGSARIARGYPHELSGGMRQRVLIGIGIANDPALLVADEPTSGLDVTVARRILDYLDGKIREKGMALVIVTHDLGIATRRADRVLTVQDGKIVETAPALSIPPPRSSPAAPAPAQPGEAVLMVAHLVKHFPGRRGEAAHAAVDDVSFHVPRHGTTGLVGESGSGKTTIARIVLGLETPQSGAVHLNGHDITHATGEARRLLRRRMQIVYQNPYASLNPRLSVEDIIDEPMRAFQVADPAARRLRVRALLDRVGLPRRAGQQTPSFLSGGQRQRVAIARALALEPELVVLDEPTSALDSATQGQILTLLRDLQAGAGTSYLFISHDLGLVREFSDHVVVLRRGRLVEQGAVRQIFECPAEAYTRELLNDSSLRCWHLSPLGKAS